MRYRVNEYTVEIENDYVWLTFQVPAGVPIENSDNEIEIFIKEAIRLIVDESASIIFCSSMQKDLYLEQASFNDSTHQIELAFSIPEDKTVTNTDEFTIEMDWGEAISDIAKTLSDKIDAIEIPTDYATETSLTSYINKV